MGGKRKKSFINADLHAGHLLPYLYNRRLCWANITLSKLVVSMTDMNPGTSLGKRKKPDLVDLEELFFSSLSLRTFYEIVTKY